MLRKLWHWIVGRRPLLVVEHRKKLNEEQQKVLESKVRSVVGHRADVLVLPDGAHMRQKLG